MQNLFMGGWDGHRLGLVDDNAIEPGVTRADDVAHELSLLAEHDYAVIYVESAKLSPDVAAAHGIFCESPVCLVVLDRRGGDSLTSWGTALAIFELNHPHGDVAGRVWMDGRMVRPPGPTTWPLFCLSKTDSPHFLHPDGAAIYPARASPNGDGFALFGPTDVPLQYHRDGFLAPAPNTCDQAVADDAKKPQPEKPLIKPDQAILQAAPPAASSEDPAPSRPRRKKKSQE
jgi:hypothetical protein